MVLTEDMAVALAERARASGFDLAGFTDLKLDEADRAGLEAFVASGMHGEMEWFSRYQSMRLDPGMLLRPGPAAGSASAHAGVSGATAAATPTTLAATARSAMVLGMVYVDREFESALAQSPYRVSRYAAGRDYHRVLKRHAAAILDLLEDYSIRSRLCVDSVPLPEKVLARRAGLGWRGKHTNIIHPDLGSWFFLGVILLECDLAVPAGEYIHRRAVADQCGRCRLCRDACPTGALFEDYKIDGGRCLSYLTIEAKTEGRRAFSAQRHGQVFGCDICQEVCPYNRRGSAATVDRRVEDFAPKEAVLALLRAAPDEMGWEALAGTSLRRITLASLQENYRLADSVESSGSNGDRKDGER